MVGFITESQRLAIIADHQEWYDIVMAGLCTECGSSDVRFEYHTSQGKTVLLCGAHWPEGSAHEFGCGADFGAWCRCGRLL